MSRTIKITHTVEEGLNNLIDDIIEERGNPRIIKQEDFNRLVRRANNWVIKGHKGKKPKKGVVPQFVRQYLPKKDYHRMEDESGEIYWIKQEDESGANYPNIQTPQDEYSG